MTTIYKVGGCVRDRLLGRNSKDIDFAVEAESFDAMRDWLNEQGFKIFVETPKFFTIRAHFPRTGYDEYAGLTADFVLCRKESGYSDGRRPDNVEVGTIYDDLARRDFTMNAMAETLDGTLIDPFNGADDIANAYIKCVGTAYDRISEDALRALRAIRFQVQLGFALDGDIIEILSGRLIVDLLKNIAVERQYDELMKMFKVDTNLSLLVLASYPSLRNALFNDRLWLKPSLENK